MKKKEYARHLQHGEEVGVISPLVVLETQAVRGRSSAMNNQNEIDRFAELLASLIEKYAEQLDLDDLPCPPRPADE